MSGMKAETKEGDSPVSESWITIWVSGVPRDTRNLVGSWEDHLPRLNTNWWPIVKKYREGKVKRTPGGEWKRTWNLVFTSSRRALRLDGVLFVERSGELPCAARLSSHGAEPKGNRVSTGRWVARGRPETGWPIHAQAEVPVKGDGGPNPRVLKNAGTRRG